MPASRFVQPAGRPFASPYPPAAVGATRKFVQGVGAALLVFTGAGAMTQTSGLQQAASSARPLFTPDFFSFEGVLQTLTSGQFAGPLQIALAVLLFVAAGRCIARFLGLAIAAAVIFLYLQGVTVEDSMMFFERFADRISAAVQAFLSADVAPQ